MGARIDYGAGKPRGERVGKPHRKQAEEQR
jgi:hypothetical protein